MARDALKDLPQGWFWHGEQVLSLVEQHQPKSCVELGTWRGASAIAIGRTLAQWGGHLTCIDVWDGEVPIEEAACNLRIAGVTNVDLIRSRTDEAVKGWTGPFDFIYIDADHAYESVKSDLELWWPLLRVGGLIAGDDYGFPGLDGVAKAWDEFEKEHGLNFEHRASVNTPHPEMKLVYGVK